MTSASSLKHSAQGMRVDFRITCPAKLSLLTVEDLEQLRLILADLSGCTSPGSVVRRDRWRPAPRRPRNRALSLR
jgi:hypothetical protein